MTLTSNANLQEQVATAIDRHAPKMNGAAAANPAGRADQRLNW